MLRRADVPGRGSGPAPVHRFGRARLGRLRLARPELARPELARPQVGPLRLARPPLLGLVLAAAALALATALAALLERRLGVADASIVYLLAVVAVATFYGSGLAVVTAVASFLLYDFFFLVPRYTLLVASAQEWLDLLLFLIVAVVIGRLGALQLARRREAELRTAEARSMFAMSREMSLAPVALEAAPVLAARLARDAEMARVWIGLGPPGAERTIADTQPAAGRPSPAGRWLLHPGSAEAQPSWVRIRDPGAAGHGGGRTTPHPDVGTASHSAVYAGAHDGVPVFRVPIEHGGEVIGSIWATRGRDDPFPGRSHTRLLAAAADQFGQSVVRDRLAAEATSVQVARESDALKSALLDAVSHDLRTPLAAIRAAAGNLMDPDVEWTRQEQRRAAESIDVEAQRLNRLVRNMLDLSRIEGGALHPSLQLYDLADLVDPVVRRLAPLFGARPPDVAIPEALPPVQADALFVDQILTNMLENAARYAFGSAVRVSARDVAGNGVELVVEDGGRGVPEAALRHLFERFYRVPAGSPGRTDGGSGVGLAVVRGLTEAMGGSVHARASRLGGLAIAVRLPAERLPAERLPAERLPAERVPAERVTGPEDADAGGPR